jgi:hypothetical protein
LQKVAEKSSSYFLDLIFVQGIEIFLLQEVDQINPKDV